MTPNAHGQCARHSERTTQVVCPRCGAFTCLECNPDGQTACPACRERAGGSAEARRPTPWERRGELGLLRGLWETWRQSVLEPQRFFPTVQPEGSPVDALIYAWLVGATAALAQLPAIYLNLAQLESRLSKMADQVGELRKLMDLISPLTESPLAFSLGLTIAGIVMVPLGLLIRAGVTHLGGLMFGAAKHDFGATLRAMAYAVGPEVGVVLPCMGSLAGLYTVVLEVWSVKEVHETTYLRAAAAVLWFLVLACCCGGAGAALVLPGLIAELSR